MNEKFDVARAIANLRDLMPHITVRDRDTMGQECVGVGILRSWLAERVG